MQKRADHKPSVGLATGSRRSTQGSCNLPLPFDPAMERQPIPPFWIVVQILIIVCVLISAVIVVVKL